MSMPSLLAVAASSAYSASANSSNQVTSSGAVAPDYTTVHCLDCWAGWGIKVLLHTVSAVYGSWILPTVTCSSTVYTQVDFLAGIDKAPPGASSPDFEYAGVAAVCPAGGVVSFYGLEGNNSISSGSSLTPVAGDVIYASIVLSSGMFTYTVKDITHPASVTFSTSASGATRDYAECIVTMALTTIPLAKFGVTSFGQYYTDQKATCYAKVGTLLEPIGGFGAHVIKYILYNSANAVVLATPSLIGPPADKSSFKIKWLASGP